MLTILLTHNCIASLFITGIIACEKYRCTYLRLIKVAYIIYIYMARLYTIYGIIVVTFFPEAEDSSSHFARITGGSVHHDECCWPSLARRAAIVLIY